MLFKEREKDGIKHYKGNFFFVAEVLVIVSGLRNFYESEILIRLSR